MLDPIEFADRWLGGTDDDQEQWTSESSSTIRLDVETAVCVFIQHLKDPPRVDLDIKITDVDGHYDDSLFRKPTSRWFRLLGPRR